MRSSTTRTSTVTSRGPGGGSTAWAVWFTGLPGSGKTTVARAAQKHLAARGVRATVLELDEIRKTLTPRPQYTEQERSIVYAALAYMAKLLVDEGANVIIDATGNMHRYRDTAHALIADFGEVYVRCPLEVCMAREAGRQARFAPEGVYRKGLAGKSTTVPGMNVPYEEPLRPIATVDCEASSPEEAGKEAADAILARFGGPHG